MRPFRIAATLSVLVVTPAAAIPVGPGVFAPPHASALVAPAAQGCGPGWWRGPWGHCRHTPYYGPLPGGGYSSPYYYAGNGCPPGWWRGPWGHCRNTPYHGPLPGGGYQ